MAITFEAYAKNNLCYKAARTMPTGSPAGIIIHSTGADNPNLKRYVNAPEICGVNPYKNYFDRPDSNVCPHAVIGKDKNGDVRAAKLLPWNVCCWGCGFLSCSQACQIMKDTNNKAMIRRLRCESIVSVLWYQMVQAGRDRHHQGVKGGILIRVSSSTNCLLSLQTCVRPQFRIENRLG